MSTSNRDRYRLDSRIATGGMGEVWRATDTVLGRQVAVKVLKHEYADDPSFRSRFETEAQHAAALHHPNVASVFDFGEIDNQDGSGTTRPFLVMELVPGQPLSALLRGGEPMDPTAAADLVAQAADAIAAAHAMDIVHRDVKPANLLVTPEGRVKITDFGIARAADAVALTQTGQLMGTPHYISPEQAEGRPATNASDIYALGVVLYECLAGRRPFAGDTPVTTALAHMRDPVPPLPHEVPEHLRAVAGRALAKKPTDRFASAAEMAMALRAAPAIAPAPAPVAAPVLAAADEGHTLVMPAQSPVQSPKRTRRGLPPWWPWVAAAAAVLLVIGLVSMFAGRDANTITSGDPSATPSASPSSSPSVEPEDDRVRVRRADYLGMDHKDAADLLEARGFEVQEGEEKRPPTSPDQERDTVAAVSPAGLVEPGSTITLTLWDEYQEDGPSSDSGDEHSNGKSKGKD